MDQLYQNINMIKNWNNNIKIVVPVGETINSISHNTRGKDKISFDEVLTKTLNSIK